MPREIVITKTVYKFEELSEKAQETALEKLAEINTRYEWWEFTLEDAKNIGLEIKEFDIDRRNEIKGKLLWNALEVADEIVKQHGEMCETYKTAAKYLSDRTESRLDPPEELDLAESDGDDEENTEELDEEFEKELLGDYFSILKEEYEYMTSREGIIETIEANDYEFTEDGEIYR